MTTPEGEIKAAVKRYIERNGWYWCAVQGGAYSKPGDPDLIACVGGRFVGIEAKTSDGRQSPVQKARQRQIEDAGGVYLIVRSLDDLTAGLWRNGLLPEPPMSG